MSLIPQFRSCTRRGSLEFYIAYFATHNLFFTGSGENDLATYCTNPGIRHIPFTDFSKALTIFQSVAKGEKSVDEVLNIGEA